MRPRIGAEPQGNMANYSRFGALMHAFQLCGTPDEKTYPGITELAKTYSKEWPRFEKQEWGRPPGSAWRELEDFLHRCLCLNHKGRASLEEHHRRARSKSLT